MVAAFKPTILIGTALTLVATLNPAPARAESYQEYLERLRAICEVECLQPKPLQRAARKNRSRDAREDMAVIMDVAEVRQAGDKYELHNIIVDADPLTELALLGTAGINTSFGSGIGGLTRNRVTGRSPEVVVIEMDKQTFFDILNAGALFVEPRGQGGDDSEGDEGLVVEGDRERETVKPTLGHLRAYFRNRRVVVRGTPRLTPVWVGGRIERRRKQVTLELTDPDYIALLPEFDDEGNAVIVAPLSE